MSDGDILAGANIEINFIVPFKFYKFKKITAWQIDPKQLAGFKVEFEPPSTYVGWEPYTQIFGTEPAVPDTLYEREFTHDLEDLKTFSSLGGAKKEFIGFKI